MPPSPPAVGPQLPPAPEGWSVHEDNRGNYFYITDVIARTGQKHKISSRSHMSQLVSKGDLLESVATSLVFKRSVFLGSGSDGDGNCSLNNNVGDKSTGPPMKKSKCELIAPQYECPQCTERVPDFQRHLSQQHQPGMGAPVKWFACLACSCLTASLEEHNRRSHSEALEEDQPDPEVSKTYVRLVLPSEAELTAVFPRATQVASILLYWDEECRRHIEEGAEVVLSVGERQIGIEEFDITLAALGALEEQEIRLVFKLVAEAVPLTEADEFLDECEDRLVKKQVDAEEMSPSDMARVMNEDRPEVPKPMVEEIVVALRRPDNPFHYSTFPHSVNKNHFITIIQFSRVHLPLTYAMCLSLKPSSTQFVSKDVFIVVELLSLIVNMVDPKCTSLKQLHTVLLKAGGLSNSSLDATQRSGHCQTSSSYRAIRTKLACIADGVVKKVSKLTMPLVMFDNMDFVLRFLQQHFTLPVLVFRGAAADTAGLPSDDAKTHEEKLELYCESTFLITSEKNTEYLEQFKTAVYTVMTDVITANFKGFGWLKKFFPTHHSHSTSAQSKEASSAHVEKPLYLPETATLDMVRILTCLQDRWLELLEGAAEDRDMFIEMIRVLRDEESTDLELTEAEDFIMNLNENVGGLLISGDQLTIDRIESAKRAQKGSVTCLERFDLISCTTSGMFHVDMNFVIYSYMGCMEHDRNLQDILTMSYFKLKLKKNWISNCSDTIKACGNFEEHRQFFESIGVAFLLEGIHSTMDKMVLDGEELEKTEEGAISFYKKILSQNNIQLYYHPEVDFQANPDTMDDLNRYASNMASRVLLSLTMRKAEREGDVKSIMAIRIILVMFFYGASKNHSKYSPTLMMNIVDYLGASTLTRKRMDLTATSNLSGKVGCNIHQDKLNEVFVKQVKQIFKDFQRCLSDQLVEVAVSASNPIRIVKNHALDSLELCDLKTGGNHSHSVFSQKDTETTRKLIRKWSPFSEREPEEQVSFSQKCTSMWETIELGEATAYIEQKKTLYDIHRTP